MEFELECVGRHYTNVRKEETEMLELENLKDSHDAISMSFKKTGVLPWEYSVGDRFLVTIQFIDEPIKAECNDSLNQTRKGKA